MGTNYYYHQNICPQCGRAEKILHIGKSSAGWVFALHIIPEEGIFDLLEWNVLWERPNSLIKDEYDRVIFKADMLKIILERNGKYHELLRNKIDKDHCIGHGAGTWDLCIGEFS